MTDDLANARQTDQVVDDDQGESIAVRKLLYLLAGEDADPTTTGIVEAAVHAGKRVERLEAENEELREEVRRLRDRTRRMNEAAEVYQSAHRNSAMARDRQAAEVLKTAVKSAPATASARQEFDARRIVDALDGEVHRTNTYEVMDRAADLVGDSDICWVQREPRTSTKNTRLIVDTATDQLPKTVAGVRIHEGVLSE